MNKFIKNVIALVCVFLMLSSLAVLAAGETHIVFTRDGNNVTATATVTDGEEKILVVTSYKNGLLKEIKTDRGSGSTLSATVKAGVDEVVANVINSFGGETVSSKAVYAADTINIRGIRVNGKDVPGFSEEANEYTLQCQAGEADIEVILEDSTTKVEITGNTSPGNAEIELTSSRGRKRIISLNLYDTEEKTYTLSNLTYMIGEEEYEISGFNPDTLSYFVELPDNTMSVRLNPQTVGQIKTYVTDTWVSSIDGVELGSIVDVASSAYPFKRNSVNNLVPIKNEIATAEVVVSNGKEGRENRETTYTIEFTARQPRLTEFNLTGCVDDRIKPAFVGGSAVNNDNGTITLSDRGWAVGNISESLLGGSAFMFVAENKNSGQWWYDNSSGEYFNFTADTAGTICILSANTFTNKTEYEAEGWTGFEQSTPSVPGTHNYKTVSKDWNDYANEYFMNNIQYTQAFATSKRAQEPGIAETNEFDSLTSQGLYAGFVRSFEAGENVSVFHSGRKDGNAIAMMAVINWDDNAVSHAPEVETETAGGEEELLPELPSLKISDPNLIIDVLFDENTDTTSNIWNDESGKDNHITLDSGVGQWVQNGYKVESGTGKIELPEAVTDTLNTNLCTIQFEISNIDIAEGCDSVGVFSITDNVFIYASNTDARLWWATTALRRPRVPFEDITSGIHTITIDKENQTINWYIGTELVDSRTMNATDKTTEALSFGTDDTEYSGSVIFKSFKVYNRVLTEAEITGGEAE